VSGGFTTTVGFFGFTPPGVGLYSAPGFVVKGRVKVVGLPKGCAGSKFGLSISGASPAGRGF
jgi:hypothetical protein